MNPGEMESDLIAKRGAAGAASAEDRKASHDDSDRSPTDSLRATCTCTSVIMMMTGKHIGDDAENKTRVCAYSHGRHRICRCHEDIL